MARYRRKPRPVDAWQVAITDEARPDWVVELLAAGRLEVCADVKDGSKFALTDNANIRAYVGDWLIRDENGILHMLWDSIFIDTYELVE